MSGRPTACAVRICGTASTLDVRSVVLSMSHSHSDVQRYLGPVCGVGWVHKSASLPNPGDFHDRIYQPFPKPAAHSAVFAVYRFPTVFTLVPMIDKYEKSDQSLKFYERYHRLRYE